MFIKKIQLKNGFKRFHNLTIDLGESPSRIVALIGKNGCGKSSIFDGMIRKNQVFNQIGNTGPKNIKFYSMNGDENYNINDNVDINFDTGTFSETLNIKKELGEGNTIFSFRNSYRYNSNLDIRELKALPNLQDNTIGASNSIDIDNRIDDNYQRLYVKLNNLLKKENLNWADAKRITIGELNTYIKQCLNIELTDLGDIQDGKGCFYFTKKGYSSFFDFNVLSAGEKEVIDIITDLYIKHDMYNNSIYIIDEPELHLNTSIQKKLLITINEIIPENCQIWIATHSIGFLRALQNDLRAQSTIIYFDNIDDLTVNDVVLTPVPFSYKNLKNIFSTALDDLSGLLSPETIIYCEGRKYPDENGEEIGLDAVVYNQIFEQEYPNVLFVSSGGSSEPDKYGEIALKILKKAFQGVQLLILKDKDINGNGSTTTDEQREEWLQSNTQMNRMLKRREIENYLFDYEILSKFHQIDRITYDTMVNDIKEGEVKSLTSEFMQLFGVNNMFNKYSFKKELAKFITPDTEVYRELKEIIF